MIFNTQNLGFVDPRAKDFGYRFYVNHSDLKNYSTQELIFYHQRRINFKIPEGYYDLTKDKFVRTHIASVPTGIDTEIFIPGNKIQQRKSLNLPQKHFIFAKIKCF